MKKLPYFLIACLYFSVTCGCGNNQTPEGSPLPVHQESYIEFTSNPSGASVEIAVEVENNNFKPGTGRLIGSTPVKTVLTEDDITDKGMVNFIMTRNGLTTIGQVKADKPPVAGNTYTYNHNY